jgi:hypothetical protein
MTLATAIAGKADNGRRICFAIRPLLRSLSVTLLFQRCERKKGRQVPEAEFSQQLSIVAHFVQY